MDKKSKIAFLVESKFEYQIQEILKYFETRECEVLNPNEQLLNPRQYKCAITIHSVSLEIKNKFDTLKSLQVPTIMLQDGIIENRHLQYTKDRALKKPNKYIPRYQPCFSDYIFTFGEFSSHLIQSLGNDDCKIIETGCSRVDSYFKRFTSTERKHKFMKKAHNIGIATSNTPGYNYEEKLKTCRLILEAIDELTKRGMVPILRLGKNLEAWITATLNSSNTKTGDNINTLLKLRRMIGAYSCSEKLLHNFFDKCDFLLTTPSTIQLEAMASGLPVAHLLIDQLPVIQQAVWSHNLQQQSSLDIDKLQWIINSRNDIEFAAQEAILKSSLLTDANSSCRIAKNIQMISEEH